MNGRIVGAAAACLLASIALLAGGCGGQDATGVFGGADAGPGAPPVAQTMTFWAANIAAGYDYQLQADKVGEGSRCYVYVEQGRTVTPSAIASIVGAFDAAIYPGATRAFGSEPNPGIDNDAKVFILLLDIRDGAGPSDPYIAGYFDPTNEATQSEAAAHQLHSNEKEMFYMDIDPGVAGDSDFLRTLAHEFQHMIHFQQEEVAKGGLADDVWLNEAMSLIAPGYCSYGPDYLRVAVFEAQPFNSLTIWDGTFLDYGVAYMWAQYVKDRIDPSSGNTVFWRMLHRPETGIASVNAALTEVGYARDFGGVFRDWAVANYSGNALSWPGHPEWSYTTVNTWPGIHPIGGGYAVLLHGMFGYPSWTDCTALMPLEPWSVDYYLYRPLAGNGGSVTWAATYPWGWASLADNTSVSFGMVSGSPYSYTGEGYLILANPSGNGSAAGDGVAYASRGTRPASVAAMLSETRRDPAMRRLVAATGRPYPLCVHPFLKEKARPLREKRVPPAR